MPEVTILMPVYNGEKYIGEAVNSILNQTFTDFELLIMDDGSTDNTARIIETYTDNRIRLIRRKHDFISNLNEGLDLAHGEFIARMDADDVMHSERLRIQLKRMKMYPEITVCGSWFKKFKQGENPELFKIGEGFIDGPLMLLLRNNFIAHPSVMIRKSFLTENSIKYDDYPCTEDYKLWFEIAKKKGIFFIEPQYLLFFRKSDSQVTVLKKDTVIRQSEQIKNEVLYYLLTQRFNDSSLMELYSNLMVQQGKGLVSNENIFQLFNTVLKNFQTSNS